MTIQLNALDTLFFKDGKPFSLGEETWADGIFPPPPSVIYGALRTALMSGELFANTLGDLIHRTDALQVQHFSVRLGGQDEYYPLPLDVVEHKDKGFEEIDYEVFPLEIKEISSGVVHNNKWPVFPQYRDTDNNTVEAISDGLISRANLISYLKGKAKKFKVRKWSDYLENEPKIGIKRNRQTLSTSADDGELYRVGMKRMKGARIQVSYSWTNNEEHLRMSSKLMRLGAEGKVVEVSGLKEEAPWSGPTGIRTRFIKVYLTTPGLFKGDGPDLSPWGVQASLRGMAIGKLFSLGGFDMKERQPKPMLKAIPSGSVFYYKAEEEVDISVLQGKAMADKINGIDYAKQGFGIAYAGTWKPEK
ncbi:MAG: type III-B CRISPR module-associated protein Cmr3 [Phaeodactylibacter sp.]|nr:type III-B CRISPR module-associated protein Cmr3 [Phaeodactylibacter sp.]